MSSPFPGMDPYLEAYWGDVHTSLVTYARDQLRANLPADLKVRVEEHVTVEADDARLTGFYPDVSVLEQPRPERVEGAGVSTAVAVPLIVPMELERETERSLRIIDTRSGNRVVTAIKFLSLSNKLPGVGRQKYLRKQRDLLDGQVNLVEIDLLRDGPYVLAAPAQGVPDAYLRPYRVCVVRATHPERAEVYRLSLREALPVIRVPLREDDGDVPLDLQALIVQSYENGGYGDIDYNQDPIPRLTGDDAEWAAQRLHQQGRRAGR